MMKKVLSCLLAVMLFLTCIPTAMAVDNARDFFFELSVDGSDKKEVQPGDIIQVDFNLKRSDSGDAYTMYGMQNEIRYDSNFFELVEGSALLSNGISTTDIGLRDNYREFYMNFVSLSGGEVKRIEIATILARRGDLMIFDEPEAGIDLWSFARLTETFEQIHQEGRATMIIISHQERIIRLADEIVVIANGQIAHRGSTEEVFPLILADTLGGCPVLERKEGAQ